MVSMSSGAHAAETVPGSACSISGMIQQTGGPEQLPGQDLICDGTVWRVLSEKITNGTVLSQVGYDSGACVAAKTGRMRYSSATDVWEYCNGSDPWLPFKKPLCQNDDTGECLLAAARNSGDPDFIAANIALGVNILGVVGTQLATATIAATKLGSDGDIYTCFLTSSGRAYCWGDYHCYNGDGNCSNAWGVNIPTLNYAVDGSGWTTLPAPREVYGGYTDWTKIYSGAGHSCGLRGNTAYCWGENNNGQLGTGNNTDLLIPGLVAGGYTDWVALAMGGINETTQVEHTCGVRSNGRLYCWGHNGDGQLGSNNNTSYNAPNEVNGATTDWAMVSAGAWHTCALKTTGRLYCWGWGNNGALGTGSYTTRLIPFEVSGVATDWAFVDAGGQNTCAIKTTGRLYCWGVNGNGSIGNGNTTQYNTPQEVSGATTDWVKVSVGHRAACGIRTSGRLYCWGFGGYGQLGNGTLTVTQNTPTEVSGGFTDWVEVAVGGGANAFPSSSSSANTWGRVCAIRSNGILYCWGDGDGPLSGDGVFRRWNDNNYITTPNPVLMKIE